MATTFGERLAAKITTYQQPRRSVQLGRAVIALAQLSLMTLTTWPNLTPEILGQVQAPVCAGLSNASLFCLAPGRDALFARMLIIAVLLTVISGLLPRIVSVLHFYASASVASSIGLPDGGEQVAQVVTFLLIIISVHDGRLCAWTRPKGPSGEPSTLAGVSIAGWWALRVQMSFIYAESGISKLSNEDWLNGSAMYYVVRDPSFGASGLIGRLAESVTHTPLGTALLTWGTIAGEVTIAVLLLMGPVYRRRALVLVVLLHIGIILVIGLWSFATVMMGAVVIAAFPHLRPSRSGSIRARSRDVTERHAPGSIPR